ncbi:hypothetical protein EVAR_70462_1 [Eumeta japonica]|uniref:Uncharacterized protein n=1 Tax=Eumeta variegata TaxID=151549 RepID=A0A4C2ABF8_EUMVA|nr:hypothetical protein EVAR_70462_1 [Eumeta japonica]
MDHVLDLLASYLTNRIQKVDVNNMRSSGSVVRMGVPQGLILVFKPYCVMVKEVRPPQRDDEKKLSSNRYRPSDENPDYWENAYLLSDPLSLHWRWRGQAVFQDSSNENSKNFITPTRR